MYGQAYKPPSRKRPLGRAKRMGGGKAPSGAFQAGYDAAMRDAKARRGGNGTGRAGQRKTYSTGRETYAGSNYGRDDDESYFGRAPARVGWRF